MLGASPATTLVILLSLLLILGFFLGSRTNRLRARVQANWLRAALRTLGAEPRFSQLGAFGFTAEVQGLSGPVRAVDAAVILLPREVPPLWLARVLTGRSDVLTLRATLGGTVSTVGDLIDPSAGYGRRAAQRIPREWSRAGREGLVLAAPDRAALERLERLASAAQASGLEPQIVSLRRAAPQLLVTLAVPASPDAMLAALAGVTSLAEAAGGPQRTTAPRAPQAPRAHEPTAP